MFDSPDFDSTSAAVPRRPRYHQVLVSRELGGAGLVALHVARHLREHDGDCDVWVPGEGAAWREAERMGLPVQGYDAGPLFSRSPARAAVANARLAVRMRQGRDGLVHVHSPAYYGAMRWGLGLTRLRRVVHVHLEEPEEGLRWAFRSPPDLIVTCARFLVGQVRGALPEHCREPARVVAVPNAVDTSAFAPGDRQECKRKVGAPAGRPLALMLANLSPHKGQETAVRAVALLKQRGVDVTLWLAGVERGGAGEFTARLNGLIRETGVGDRVALLGQRKDAPDLLRAADFFLLPSTREGLPLSVLEAQATRVPVLAAPTSGIPEVVHDSDTGYLIDAGDAEGYATRMALLLDRPDLGRRLADAAYSRTTREHNWPTYVNRIHDLYRDLGEGGARAAFAGRHDHGPPKKSESTASQAVSCSLNHSSGA